MRTYYVVATNEEVELIKGLFPQAVEIIVTGVGGTNVMRKLESLPRDSRIINVGYAGSRDIPRGTSVAIGKASLYHAVCDYDEPEFSLVGGLVRCFTSNDFVTVSNRKGCVFDMELAFICAMGFTEVRSVKVISDNLDYGQYEEQVR